MCRPPDKSSWAMQKELNGATSQMCIRDRDITGPWSEHYELANGREYAQLYGSYIHPFSVTGDNLYFTMSMWMPYNFFLMKAELADMGEF